MNDPSPAWRFKTELFEQGSVKLASRGPNLTNNPNTEIGVAAGKCAELKEDDAALVLMRRLQNYVIYSPTTGVLRGVVPETQPRHPLGLSGGRLPESIRELLSARSGNQFVQTACSEALHLVTWAKGYGAANAVNLPLSPAASTAPVVVRFTDRYMMDSRNVLSGYDASEGALYVLSLAVLAAHSKAPAFFAVDNADHGLNPGLASSLMKHFAKWFLENDAGRQVLMTTHNPAVLDGLPLNDDRVRLFTVDRDNKGKTVIKRVEINEKLLKKSAEGWTLSRLWMNKLIGGMPDV
jgi:hypothetical protein